MGSFQKPNFNIPLGHLREEGGGQNLNFPNFLVKLIEKIPSKMCQFSKTSPNMLYMNLISMHKFVIL